jgi:thiol:disulfide interchange protein DsbD
MKKKLFFCSIALIAIMTLNAQVLQPVKWNFAVNRIDNSKVELVASATIDDGWHLYSIHLPEDGPVPTSLVFNESDAYSTVGDITETPAPTVENDKTFGMELAYFSKNAKLTQVLEIKAEIDTLRGYVEFMACDDSRCLPPDQVEFALAVPATVAEAAETKGAEVVANNKNDEIAATTTSETKGYWSVFWAAFVVGLASLLLPCVYPMIPITVSFFLRNADNKVKAFRDGFFYGLTIIFSYVVVGIAVTLIFGAQALSSLAASPGFNVFFFLLLAVFAASFFGAFELTLPSKWSNALDQKADQTTGILSVVFMGLTFVIVSFSCTGPAVGSLLVEVATQGNLLSPAIGMFGFSLALAIPFTLFAIFPAAMKSLPKSGGWMNSVKVVLGFIVLAFAMKYLSSADAAAGWGILDREIFIAIWIAIFLLMGFYLMGKIKFAHDSELKHIGIFRLVLIIATFSFVFYLIPGLWGAPLKGVAAFLPSITTQDFDMSRGVAAAPAGSEAVIDGDKAIAGPYGLVKYIDYEAGIAAAKKENKPVLLYFTGHVCTNCKKMETSVWSNPTVTNLLKQYIIIALYTDERKSLPESEQYVSEQTGKTIKTVGAKWMDFQIEHYQTNTQPLYVPTDHSGRQLALPTGVELDVKKYAEWLKSGLEQ